MLREFVVCRLTANKGKTMKKKLIIIGMILTFTSNLFAQSEVFLSLTRSEEPVASLPTNITVITQDEIAQMRVNSLGEILENQVGIFFKTNGTVGDMPTVFIRGAAKSARTLVLIDGRRANTGGDGAANFMAIPATAIERVEIIRGSGSAIYGSGAFGGVINVITKTANADTPKAAFGASYGADKTYNPYAVMAYYSDEAAVFFAGSLYQTDGYRENSDFNGTNLFFNGSVKISDNSKLALSANNYNTDFGYPGSTVWQDPGRRKDFNRYFKADYIFSCEDTSLTVSVYASNDTGFNDSTAGWDNSKWATIVYGGQADFTWKDILVGTEFYWEQFQNENTQDGGMTINDVTIDKARDNAAVYAQYDRVFSGLRVLPSVRYDNNSAFGGVFTPSLSTVFNFTQGFKISANAGKVWRAPSFNDLYSPWGANPNLRPEDGFSGDFGAEYTGKNYFAGATGFFIKSDNLIEWDMLGIPQNIDKARQYGAELSAGYEPVKFLKGQVNYTYLKSENLSDGFKDKVLAFSPEHSINFTLAVKPINALRVSATVGYKSEYYENASNTNKNNGFSTLDLGVDYKATNAISLWIKGFNIANADYQIVNGYPMPGVTVYAGFDFKFWK